MTVTEILKQGLLDALLAIVTILVLVGIYSAGYMNGSSASAENCDVRVMSNE